MEERWLCLRRLLAAVKGPVATLRADSAATVRPVLELRIGNCIFQGRIAALLLAPFLLLLSPSYFVSLDIPHQSMSFRIAASGQRWIIPKVVIR